MIGPVTGVGQSPISNNRREKQQPGVAGKKKRAPQKSLQSGRTPPTAHFTIDA